MTVTGKDASQCQAVLSQVEEDTAGENVACQSADWEERQAAQAAGLPLGKYRVYAEIAALDGAFTPEEAQSMTMRQLRDLLEELSGQGQASAKRRVWKPAHGGKRLPRAGEGRPGPERRGPGPGNGPGPPTEKRETVIKRGKARGLPSFSQL